MYLKKVFKLNKIAFTIIIVFILFYIIILSKTMDMFPFRHNGMFVRMNSSSDTFYYNIFKVDKVPINYTGYFYWKKDFIESSLSTYVSMCNSQNFNLLEKSKIYKYIHNPKIQKYFIENLCMKPGDENKYPVWLYSFCLRKKYNDKIKIEIVNIKAIYRGNEFVKIDSTIIYYKE